MSLLSLIIPTKDRRELLGETLEGLRRQTSADWEAVVVDDGSSDGTAELVEAMSGADDRFRLERPWRESRGAPACRNHGLRVSRGQWVVFLDSDDVPGPEMVAGRLAFMADRPGLDFGVSGLRVFHATPGDCPYIMNRETGEDDLERFLRHDYPWQTTGPTWRRASIEGLGGFDESYPMLQDVELHVRALAAGLRYERLGVDDLFYRSPRDGRAMITRSMWASDRLPVHERFLERAWEALEAGGCLSGSRGGRYRELLAGNAFWIAQKWADAGERGRGLALWRRAWERGWLDAKRHAQGARFLRVHGTPAALLLIGGLCRRWPEAMWVRNRSTICKTLPEERHLPAEALTWRERHRDPRYREVLQDGWWRFAGRRLKPGRLMASAGRWLVGGRGGASGRGRGMEATV